MSGISGTELPPSPELAHEPPPTAPARLNKTFVVALAILYLGTYMAAVGLSLVSWPITVARIDPDNKVMLLSVVTGLYALVNIVMTPVAGTLSDHCTWRFGMRRPFLLIGAAFSITALVVMGLSTNMTMLLLGVVLQGIGNSCITGAASALVPDQVPEESRGRIQGVVMVCIALSGVLASVFLPMFTGNQLLLFTAPAALMAVAVVIVNVVLKDRVLTGDERAAMGRLSFVSEFKIDPRAVPDYSWVWIGKVVVILATVLTSTYGVYVLTDQLGVSEDELPSIITMTGLIGLVASIGGAVAGSWISDRFRIRKSLVLWTTVFIAAGAVIVAFSTSVPVYLVGLAVLGLGSGAYSPVDGALAIDVLPGGGRESGKYMALMTVADQLPRSFGPILGSVIVGLGGAAVAIGGYSLVYLTGAVVAILGGLLVRKVRGSM